MDTLKSNKIHMIGYNCGDICISLDTAIKEGYLNLKDLYDDNDIISSINIDGDFDYEQINI